MQVPSAHQVAALSLCAAIAAGDEVGRRAKAAVIITYQHPPLTSNAPIANPTTSKHQEQHLNVTLDDAPKFRWSGVIYKYSVLTKDNVVCCRSKAVTARTIASGGGAATKLV